MLINILTVVVLVGITALYFKLKSPSLQDIWLNEAEMFTIEGVLNYTKQALNDMTMTNINSLGLSKEAYQRELFKRSELITALRRCVYGSIKDKQYVKDIIHDLLRDSYINAENIDQIIPFDYSNRLSVTDKFDIILYFYKKQYGKQAFGTLVERYRFDQPKQSGEDMGKQYYEIDEDDILRVYADEAFYLTLDDKFNILAQRIYQLYKGFSVIDELRDMQIDGVSGGVSGIVDSIDNIESLMKQFKRIPYNYDSVWVFYRGVSIHLSCITFGNINELRRVCQNIYRYNNIGMLSQSKGYKINEMIDGSRVVVVRPDFSESWAFFIRKFNLSHTALDKLITDHASELPINFIQYLAKGGRVSAITGSQGSGKTTLLMAMIGSIYGTLTLRIQEMAFELHLRKLYPKRNILSFKETPHISGQVGLDVQKKTDGSVNILGEVATDEVAAWMIQMTQVASLFTLFTHHAKTTKDLVLSLRNSLLKCDVFRNEEIAEEQVVSVLNFDIHLNRDFDGKRYIERITEIIPVDSDDVLPQDYQLKEGEEMQRAFMDTMTSFFKQMTDRKKYITRDIITFDGERYVAASAISERQIEAMKSMMLPDDRMAFEAFIARYWQGAYDVDVIA